MKNPSEENRFRTWLKSNYGIQDYEAYRNTQTEELAIQFAAQSVREELTLFHDWFNTLSPADKCTVWPPAGSGSGCGLYNKETSAIIEDFLSKRAKGKIPSPPTNKG